jgi:hypothetical protein
VVVIYTFQLSLVPAAADFVGLISVGLEEPITTLTEPEYGVPLSVQVRVPGVETLIDVQVGPETDTLLFCRLFQPKEFAEGDAVLVLLGKLITMVPLAGMVETVVNAIVCLAVIGTMSVSVPACAVEDKVLPKYTVVAAAD